MPVTGGKRAGHDCAAVAPGRCLRGGQALRETREARDISQEQFAFNAGFDRTYVSMVQRGDCSLTIRTVVKLARVLQVPVPMEKADV